jgi:hypothetical protein
MDNGHNRRETRRRGKNQRECGRSRANPRRARQEDYSKTRTLDVERQEIFISEREANRECNAMKEPKPTENLETERPRDYNKKRARNQQNEGEL